jgi:hypothetical protein
MRRSLAPVLGMAFLLVACGGSPGAGTDPNLFFPTEGDPGGESMAAGFRGPLVVRDGCVLAGESVNLTLPIWRDGFTASRDGEGNVVVKNPDGDTVAVEGEVFEMGGGYIAEFEPRNKVEPMDAQLQQVTDSTGITIPERCLGPDVYGVWWAGDVQTFHRD